MVYLREGRTQEAFVALLWAEETLDEHDPLLAATRAELEKLQRGGAEIPGVSGVL